MAIDELLRVIPPPAPLTEPGDPVRWEKLQEQLGTQLPRDYGDFGMLYGSGTFAVGLRVWNPFGAGFLTGLATRCRGLREERGLLGRRGVAYGVFPDQPGWLPFGDDELGSLLCWVTEGEPDDWPILLMDRNRRSFQQARLPLAAFLARLSEGRLPNVLGFGPAEDNEFPSASFVPDEPRPLAGRDREEVQGYAAALAADRVGQGIVPPQVEWLGPDRLGRPTGVRTVLAPGFESGPREVFTVYPEWWGQLPAPRRRWVRHHLLGWRLGGPGKEALHNLVPLTQEAHYSMCLHEAALADEVRDEGLVYTVRLIYEGEERYPRQFIAEGKPYPGSGSAFRFYHELQNTIHKDR